MSLEFPRYNPRVEDDFVSPLKGDARVVTIEELSASVLGEFCPVSRGMAASRGGRRMGYRVSRIDLEAGRCSEECRQ